MKTNFRFALLLLAITLFSGMTSTPRLLSVNDILNLANHDRSDKGLSPLSLNPVLSLAALAKAQDMINNRYFAHTSPEGVNPWYWFRALGYKYTYAGENLAAGFTDPNDLENSWMNSPDHRANILSPFYGDVGLAVVKENNVNIIVELFGSKANQVSVRQ
ncbi:MAG TPA: CAP domain-containing protein [Methylomirabilota bacterium]|nr:CAP domain-containing protein [Methylomirabilota bacterium]